MREYRDTDAADEAAADEAAAEPAADEQMTVPEDRDEAAAAEGRSTSPEMARATSTAEADRPEPAEPVESDSTSSVPGSTLGSDRPNGEGSFELFRGHDRDDYRRRWEVLQASFVDDPRAAAEQADSLVSELVEQVTQRHRELHDEVGARSERDDTEAMRLTLRRYRSLFTTLVGG